MATVVCEKHGLRYDPERANGCVICRREEGGAPPSPRASGRARIGLGPVLLLTVAIWLVAGFLLSAAHRAVVRSLRDWGVASQAAEPAYDDTWNDPGTADPYAAEDDASDDGASWESEEDDG